MYRDADPGESHGRLSPHDPCGDLDEASAIDADLSPDGSAADGRTPVAPSAREWSADQTLRALNQVLAAIAGNLNLRSLIGEMLETAIRTLRAERGVVFVGRGGQQGLVPILARGIGGEELEEIEGVSRTILAAARLTPLVIADALRDPRFRDVPSIRAKQVRSVACAPLACDGDLVGAIYLDAPSRTRAFPEQCMRFLTAFARLAGVALRNARLYGRLQQQNQRLRRRTAALAGLGRIAAASPQMSVLLQRASVAAWVDSPVLVIGEEGTEKELIARTLHELGPRAMEPFVAVQAAGLTRELEVTLFGPSRGDRHPRTHNLPPLLRRAEHGILFIEEINQLSRGVQAQLARLLRAGRHGARPPGGVALGDVRVVASLNRPPRAARADGTLLPALHEELGILELHIPPLRERSADIPVLVEHFLHQHAAAEGHPLIRFTPSASALLQSLTWDGNVAELESLVHRVLVLSDQAEIDARQLEHYLRAGRHQAQSEETSGPLGERRWSGLHFRSLAEQERDAIRNALAHAGGNQSAAARILGIHRNTLLRRIKALDISGEWAAAQRPRKGGRRRRSSS